MRSQLTNAIMVALLSLACEKEGSRLEILSLRNPIAPETLSEVFPTGRFRLNSGRAYEIVFELEPRLLEVSGEPREGDDPATQPAASDLVWTSQLVHIQLLWQAHPGKSYVESSQTNAAIIYCLINGENAISYEGAGFVYFELSRDGRSMEGTIESASLRPTRFGHAPVDLFGACRLQGEFTATSGAREVASIRQRLRRRLGPPPTTIEAE